MPGRQALPGLCLGQFFKADSKKALEAVGAEISLENDKEPEEDSGKGSKGAKGKGKGKARRGRRSWADWSEEQEGTATGPQGQGQRSEEGGGRGGDHQQENRRSGPPPARGGGGGGGEGEDDGFDPWVFLGTWRDNLGHTIDVVEFRQRRYGRVAFSARFTRPGSADKTFTIARSRVTGEWACGNGQLMREETNAEEIVWKAEDGRESEWIREATAEEAAAAAGLDAGGAQGQRTRGDSNVDEDAGANFRLPPADDGGAGGKRGPNTTLSAAAYEFVPGMSSFGPGAACAAESLPTREFHPSATTPLGTPSMRPRPAPAEASFPVHEITLLQDSPDVRVNAGRLEWTLPDAWEKLSSLPKDFCSSSPLFGVERAPSMQLVFYPNGSRTAEEGRCTLAVCRGPGCAGVKFELSVNGRSSGPKACISQRYLGDFPRPYQIGDEQAGEPTGDRSVVVGMQILEVFGGEF